MGMFAGERILQPGIPNHVRIYFIFHLEKTSFRLQAPMPMLVDIVDDPTKRKTIKGYKSNCCNGKIQVAAYFIFLCDGYQIYSKSRSTPKKKFDNRQCKHMLC